MKLLSRSNRQYCNAILLLSLAFQMFVVITPASGITGDVNSSLMGKPGVVKDIPMSSQNGGRIYFISAVTAIESINETETNLSIDRNSLGFRGLILRFFKLLLPYTGLGVLVLCFGYVIKKKDQHKSILASYLGGHAPPQGLQLLFIS